MNNSTFTTWIQTTLSIFLFLADSNNFSFLFFFGIYSFFLKCSSLGTSIYTPRSLLVDSRIRCTRIRGPIRASLSPSPTLVRRTPAKNPSHALLNQGNGRDDYTKLGRINRVKNKQAQCRLKGAQLGVSHDGHIKGIEVKYGNGAQS